MAEPAVPVLGATPPDCPLRRHAAYFANPDGSLDAVTMTNRHVEMEKADTLKTTPLKVSAILHTSNTLAGLQTGNPSRTGLWRADGSFDEEVFKVLDAKAIVTPSGTRILLRRHFDELRKPATWWPPTYATVFGFIPIPITWKAVTDGSLGEFFKFFSDCVYNGEPAVTPERTREFYLDSPGMMAKLKAGSLPPPKQV
jgi:hypothetical protein